MKTFKLEIAMDNAAFEDGWEHAEVARIIKTLADKFRDFGFGGTESLYDSNGNKVGTWKVTL